MTHTGAARALHAYPESLGDEPEDDTVRSAYCLRLAMENGTGAATMDYQLSEAQADAWAADAGAALAAGSGVWLRDADGDRLAMDAERIVYAGVVAAGAGAGAEQAAHEQMSQGLDAFLGNVQRSGETEG